MRCLQKFRHLNWVSRFVGILILTGAGCSVSKAQQFNSDNYLTMPKGTGTFILTAGQRNAGFISSFALLNRYEFFAQTTLFWDQPDDSISQHFTLNLYAKYMFWINKKKTGGGGIFLGYGNSPSYYLAADQFTALHKNIWSAVAITIPFFNNIVSWDIMPGALVDFEYKEKKNTAWGFSYSTRLAIYKIIPESAIVGEVYGTAGEAFSPAEYKVGVRWEPNDFIIPAISYGGSFNGSPGAGLEIGIIIFTPPFIRKEYIREHRIDYNYDRQHPTKKEKKKEASES